MPWRRLLLALLLPACPSAPRHPPPPPPASDDAGDVRGEADASQDPPEPDPSPPVQPPPTAGPTPPAFSAPRADDSLAETLPPPGPRALPGGCEGGTRRPGETWKVDCNECSCGADGQSSCTAMACVPRPVR